VPATLWLTAQIAQGGARYCVHTVLASCPAARLH
jgi:hypothetical protein